MFPLVTALRLFQDKTQLKHDNFDKTQDRRFRSGRISPFSANVAFVLHRCNQTLFSDTDSEHDQYKVSLLVNEMPIELYGLNEVLDCSKDSTKKSVCDLRDFRHLIHSYLNDNLSDVCRLGAYGDLKVSKYVSLDFENSEL